MSHALDMTWSRWANRTVSRWRALGGKLSLASDRVAFGPHAFDEALGGMPWEAMLVDIVAVDAAPVQLSHATAGGLRRRLRITLRDGSRHLFVVNRLDEVISDIRSAVGLHA